MNFMDAVKGADRVLLLHQIGDAIIWIKITKKQARNSIGGVSLFFRRPSVCGFPGSPLPEFIRDSAAQHVADGDWVCRSQHEISSLMKTIWAYSEFDKTVWIH